MPTSRTRKTSEMMTRTGFSVNRLARSIGVTVLALNQMNSKVKPPQKQRLPEYVMGQQASEKKGQHAQCSAEDRHIIQQKATVPQRIGSPTPVSHIANAVAIPTAAFMIVIVTRYAEMSLSILLRDFRPPGACPYSAAVPRRGGAGRYHRIQEGRKETAPS